MSLKRVKLNLIKEVRECPTCRLYYIRLCRDRTVSYSDLYYFNYLFKHKHEATQ